MAFNPPSSQNPYASPWSSGNNATSRNPWSRFSRMSPMRPGSSTSVPTFGDDALGRIMAQSGFRSDGTGGFSRAMNRGPAWAPRVGPHTMDAGAAATHARGQLNLGLQGARAANQDFQALAGIIDENNQQRAGHLEGIQRNMGQVEIDRLGAVSGLARGADAGATAMEERADANLAEWREYRDGTVQGVEDYAKDVERMAFGVRDEFDSMAVDNISAAHAGMMNSGRNQIKQIEAEARMSGLSPEATQARVADVRENTLRQAQSSLSPMIDQKNQVRLQAGMQAVQATAAALGQAATTRNWAMTSTANILQHRDQISQAAQSFRQAGRMQAVQANAQFEQIKLAYGDQEARAIGSLGQRYASAYDAFLQMSYSATTLGGRRPFTSSSIGN